MAHVDTAVGSGAPASVTSRSECRIVIGSSPQEAKGCPFGSRTQKPADRYGHLHGGQRRGHTIPGRDADVDGPRADFPEDIHVGHAPEFDADVRLFDEEDRQRRQQDVSAWFITADPQDRAVPLRKLPDRCRGFAGHSQQSDRIGEKGMAGRRQCGVLRLRSNKRSPRSSSRRRIAWLTAGWVRQSLIAAREKLCSAATVTKTLSSPSSIGP